MEISEVAVSLERIQALARFAQPEAQLEAYLQSPNPCVRINAARAYAKAPRRRPAFLLAHMEKETNPLVILNLLRGVSDIEKAIPATVRLCRKVPELCRRHLPYIAAAWPQGARTLSEWIDSTEKPATSKTSNGIVRFHFQALPRNIACIAVENPADGARAMVVPPENDLTVLHLTHDVVSLHPIYQ